MKQKLKWVKDHAVEILAAIGAVLLGFLAWGEYNRRVGRLKDSVKVERARVKVAALEAKRDEKVEQEVALAEKDEVLEKKIVEAKRKVVDAHERVEGRSDAEVVSRFNELYPSG